MGFVVVRHSVKWMQKSLGKAPSGAVLRSYVGFGEAELLTDEANFQEHVEGAVSWVTLGGGEIVRRGSELELFCKNELPGWKGQYILVTMPDDKARALIRWKYGHSKYDPRG